MKNTFCQIKYVAYLICFLLVTFNSISFAQLSGTYTIGGSSPDYSTIASAVSDLNTNGVNGAVTFDIRSGSYTEQVSIGTVSGVSSTNTVTFQSENQNKEDVTIQYTPTSSNNYIIQLDGSDYVTFQHLTLQTTGSSSYGRVFDLSGDIDYLLLQHCDITGFTVSSTDVNHYFALFYAEATSCSDNFSNVTITSNTFLNGSKAIMFRGYSSCTNGSSSIVQNNSIANFYDYGIYAYLNSDMLIDNNSIEITNSSGSGYAMLCVGLDNGSIVSRNNISSTQSGISGIQIGGTGTSSDPSKYFNNMIHIIDGVGLNITGGEYHDIYHNSVNITGSSSSSICLQLVITSGTFNTYNIENNIFNNESSGKCYYCFGSISFARINNLNYNCYYTNGSVLASHSSTNYTTFSSFQSYSGKDANSVNVNPNFMSSTNLHLSSSSPSGVLDINNLKAGISEDFDGDARITNSYPDMGADEYNAYKYWDGSQSTDWSDPDNWTPSGVPTENTTAVIFNWSNKPEISSKAEMKVGNLVIMSGAYVYVPSNSELEVTGSFTNYAGSTALKVLSDNTGTGSLISNYTIDGTVQRYCTGSGGGITHLVSSPVSSANISAILDVAKGNYNAYEYDPGASGWSRVFSSDNMTVGHAFSIAYNSAKTIEFNGALQAGDQTGISISGSVDDWNLLGNPYPSPVSISDFITNNTNIKGTLYLWDESSNRNSSDYFSCNSSGTVLNSTNGNNPGKYIDVGQGFFVQSNGSGNTVYFDNDWRTGYNSNFLTPQAMLPEQYFLTLSGNMHHNKTLIAFCEKASDGFDRLYDGEKLSGNPNISFYSILKNDEKKMVIQGLPFFDENKIVGLGFYVNHDGNFNIHLDKNNILNEFEVVLEDRYLNSFHKLNKSSYSFDTKAGEFNDRFILHFRMPNSNIQETNKISFNVYNYQNELYIISDVNELIDCQIRVFNILGKQIFNEMLSLKNITKLQHSLPSGSYIVTIDSNKISYSEKIIVLN